MAVIPSGTSEPWFWAAREAAANDALARMFEQEAMRRDMQQEQFQENERAFQRQTTRDEAQREFYREQSELNRAATRENLEFRYNQPGVGRMNKGADAGPGVTPELLKHYDDIETKLKLPKGLLATMVGIESDNGRLPGHPDKRYGGYFQIGQEVIDDINKSYGGKVNVKLEDRNDPYKAAEIAALYANLNRDRASAKGMKFDGSFNDVVKLYMMHQQGPGGGFALLSNPGKKAVEVAPALHILRNAGTSAMTAQQFVAKQISRFTKYYNAWDNTTTGGTKFGGAPSTAMSTDPQRLPSYAGPGGAAATPGMPIPVPGQDTNANRPATSTQPGNVGGQTQVQPGDGAVPPSTVSPDIVPTPPPVVMSPGLRNVPPGDYVPPPGYSGLSDMGPMPPSMTTPSGVPVVEPNVPAGDYADPSGLPTPKPPATDVPDYAGPPTGLNPYAGQLYGAPTVSKDPQLRGAVGGTSIVPQTGPAGGGGVGRRVPVERILPGGGGAPMAPPTASGSVAPGTSIGKPGKYQKRVDPNTGKTIFYFE